MDVVTVNSKRKQTWEQLLETARWGRTPAQSCFLWPDAECGEDSGEKIHWPQSAISLLGDPIGSSSFEDKEHHFSLHSEYEEE